MRYTESRVAPASAGEAVGQRLGCLCEWAEAEQEVIGESALAIDRALADGNPAANLAYDADEADRRAVKIAVEFTEAKIVELRGVFHGRIWMHLSQCTCAPSYATKISHRQRRRPSRLARRFLSWSE